MWFPAFTRTSTRPIWSCWSAATPRGAIRCCTSASPPRNEARGTKIVVIDPRRTATCDIADLHLAIRPGTDVAVFAALLLHLVESGACDRDFIGARTTGFAAAVEAARACGAVARRGGARSPTSRPAISPQFFDWFAGTERTVTLYSQGVNQSSAGTDKVNAIINCHLATGRIGRARHGAVLADRAAERDGRARGRRSREPARRAYEFRQPGRYRPGAPLLGRAAHGDPARAQGGRAVRRGARRQGQGALDARHQPGRQHAARGAGPRGAGRVPVRRRQRLLADRHDALCRCRAAGRRLGREGRHGHEFGARDLAPARLPRAARRGAARLVDADRDRAPDGLGSRVPVSPPGRHLPRARRAVGFRERRRAPGLRHRRAGRAERRRIRRRLAAAARGSARRASRRRRRRPGSPANALLSATASRFRPRTAAPASCRPRTVRPPPPPTSDCRCC